MERVPSDWKCPGLRGLLPLQSVPEFLHRTLMKCFYNPLEGG